MESPIPRRRIVQRDGTRDVSTYFTSPRPGPPSDPNSVRLYSRRPQKTGLMSAGATYAGRKANSRYSRKAEAGRRPRRLGRVDPAPKSERHGFGDKKKSVSTVSLQRRDGKREDDMKSDDAEREVRRVGQSAPGGFRMDCEHE
jgi:hypothetical protein